MISVQQLLSAKSLHAVWTVRPDDMVIDALELMAAKNIGVVLVMSGDQLKGIFSERDYARKGIIAGRKAKSTPVSEVMTANVFTVSLDMTINDCLQMFSEKRIRHLPVVNNGMVVGVLSIGDIVDAMIREQHNHIQFLEQYISRS